MTKLITAGEGYATHIIRWRETDTRPGLSYGRVVYIARCSSMIRARADGLGWWKLVEADSVEDATCRSCRKFAGLSLPPREVSVEDAKRLAAWNSGEART